LPWHIVPGQLVTIKSNISLDVDFGLVTFGRGEKRGKEGGKKKREGGGEKEKGGKFESQICLKEVIPQQIWLKISREIKQICYREKSNESATVIKLREISESRSEQI
jgi:hypothetical protein